MSKSKKPFSELTTEEAMKRLFPKKVREKLKEVAHEKDEPKKARKSLMTKE